MSFRPYWSCRECDHVERMVEPSTRWGRLPPCKKCGARDWVKLKDLFDGIGEDAGQVEGQDND